MAASAAWVQASEVSGDVPEHDVKKLGLGGRLADGLSGGRMPRVTVAGAVGAVGAGDAGDAAGAPLPPAPPGAGVAPAAGVVGTAVGDDGEDGVTAPEGRAAAGLDGGPGV